MKKQYIAYGSNMDEAQMKVRCPEATVVGIGEIEGYELLFKGKKEGAYATIEPKADSRIPVLVWEISQTDEQSLDEYEAYPTLYYKKDIKVKVNGHAQEAMAYIMEESNKRNHPSKAYYQILESAYLKYGFDMEILINAIR